MEVMWRVCYALQVAYNAVKDAPSRGALTTDFLKGQFEPLQYLEGLKAEVQTCTHCALLPDDSVQAGFFVLSSHVICAVLAQCMHTAHCLLNLFCIRIYIRASSTPIYTSLFYKWVLQCCAL